MRLMTNVLMLSVLVCSAESYESFRDRERCGNGAREGFEQCDDGNNTSGDGCSSDCQIEIVCGKW